MMGAGDGVVYEKCDGGLLVVAAGDDECGWSWGNSVILGFLAG